QVPVRAHIRTITNYSAHADHSELIDWVRGRLPAHGAVFLVHGEDEGRAAMRKALLGEGLGGDQIVAPLLDEAVELRAAGIAAVTRPERRRIDPRQFSRDWHNEYAQFVIDLSDRLRAAPSDRQRLELMQALHEALGEGGAPVAGPAETEDG